MLNTPQNFAEIQMFRMKQCPEYYLVVPYWAQIYKSGGIYSHNLWMEVRFQLYLQPQIIQAHGLLSVMGIYIDDLTLPNCKYQMYFYKLAMAFLTLLLKMPSTLLLTSTNKTHYVIWFKVFLYIWIILSAVSELSLSIESCSSWRFWFLVRFFIAGWML